MKRATMCLLIAACLLLFSVSAFAAQKPVSGQAEAIEHTKNGFILSVNVGGDGYIWEIPKASSFYQKAWFVEWAGKYAEKRPCAEVSVFLKNNKPVDIYALAILESVRKESGVHVLTFDFSGPGSLYRRKENITISPGSPRYGEAEKIIAQMKAANPRSSTLLINFNKDYELEGALVLNGRSDIAGLL